MSEAQQVGSEAGTTVESRGERPSHKPGRERSHHHTTAVRGGIHKKATPARKRGSRSGSPVGGYDTEQHEAIAGAQRQK